MEQITSKNFKETLENKVVFVDFWAAWCGPCKMLGPIFEEISKEFEGKAIFAKCNVDENNTLALRQGIQAIPCIIAYDNGIEVDRSVGFLSEDDLREFVKKIIEI